MPDDRDRPVVGEPELAGDLVEQVVDVVPHAPGAVRPEVGEVLAHLRGVDARELRQPLRRDRADLLIGGLEERPVVERQPGDRRFRDAPGVGNGALQMFVRLTCGPASACRIRVPTLCTFSQSLPHSTGEAVGTEGVRYPPPRWSPRREPEMVVALAFVATAVSSLFAQAMLVRYTRTHRPEYRAWAISLALLRPGVGRPRHRHVDRLGPGHVPGLLPPRRGRERALARPRHRLPALLAADGPPRRSGWSSASACSPPAWC